MNWDSPIGGIALASIAGLLVAAGVAIGMFLAFWHVYWHDEMETEAERRRHAEALKEQAEKGRKIGRGQIIMALRSLLDDLERRDSG